MGEKEVIGIVYKCYLTQEYIEYRLKEDENLEELVKRIDKSDTERLTGFLYRQILSEQELGQLQ